MDARSPLYHRTRPMGCDVSDAVAAIIGRDGKGLPLAITREQIAKELVRIANTDDDGEVVPLSESTKKLVEENFLNTLRTSGVLQSGYELYSRETKNSVVPVTDYFFNYVYDDNTRDVLDAMSENDITQSLPKRPSLPRDAQGRIIGSDDGVGVIPSGRIAGIVVYPNGEKGPLVIAWLRRLASVTSGQAASTVRKIENARPDANVAVDHLKEITGDFNKNMRLALPKPPRAQS